LGVTNKNTGNARGRGTVGITSLRELLHDRNQEKGCAMEVGVKENL